MQPQGQASGSEVGRLLCKGRRSRSGKCQGGVRGSCTVRGSRADCEVTQEQGPRVLPPAPPWGAPTHPLPGSLAPSSSAARLQLPPPTAATLPQPNSCNGATSPSPPLVTARLRLQPPAAAPLQQSLTSAAALLLLTPPRLHHSPPPTGSCTRAAPTPTCSCTGAGQVPALWPGSCK